MKNILRAFFNKIKKLKSGLCYIYAKLQVAEMGKNCRFHQFSRFTSETHIGNDCHFNGMKIWGGAKVTIGDHFHSGEGCKIITSSHNYEGNELPYDGTLIAKDVIIEENVWLGINVILLPGSILREGCIIQAGSVVHGEIPRCAIAGGNPASVFKTRDMTHYELLKEKNVIKE